MPDPVAVDVVQAEANATVRIDVGGIGFDPLCSVPEDASKLSSLLIVGDAECVIVDADGDVNAVIHGEPF